MSFLLGAVRLGILALGLAALFVATIKAQWFPYSPPSQPCQPGVQCPYPGVSPWLTQGIDGSGNPFLEARLRFTGDAVVAGALAWIDLNPAVSPVATTTPLLYSDVWQVDGDLLAGPSLWLWAATSMQALAVGASQGTVSPWASQPPWASWQVDVTGPAPAMVDVAFARLTYSPSALPPGVTLFLTLHVVANLLHERDGSGWMASYWIGTVTL